MRCRWCGKLKSEHGAVGCVYRPAVVAPADNDVDDAWAVVSALAEIAEDIAVALADNGD